MSAAPELREDRPRLSPSVFVRAFWSPRSSHWGGHRYLSARRRSRRIATPSSAFTQAHYAQALVIAFLSTWAAAAFSLPGGLAALVDLRLPLRPLGRHGARRVRRDHRRRRSLFVAARYVFADAARRRLGALGETINAGFTRNAFSYMLFLRLVPAFPFFLVNLAPAFTSIPLRTFVPATFIGIIPGTFVFVNLGETLGTHRFAAGPRVVGDARCIRSPRRARARAHRRAAAIVPGSAERVTGGASCNCRSSSPRSRKSGDDRRDARRPAAAAAQGHEVVVVDGGSQGRHAGDCAAALRPHVGGGCRACIADERRRPRHARGDVLLFLHADTLLPAGAGTRRRTCHRARRSLGPLRRHHRRALTRAEAGRMHDELCVRGWTGIATGDQATSCRRTAFDAVSGFPAIPAHGGRRDVEDAQGYVRAGRPACARA